MYSTVLLLALSGGVEAPAHHHCYHRVIYSAPVVHHAPVYHCRPVYHCAPIVHCYPRVIICPIPGKMIEKPKEKEKGKEIEEKEKEKEKKKKGIEDEEVRAASPATLIVNLPADARLQVDGAPTNLTSQTRTFLSPNLKPGVNYTYTLTAEVVRDGKTVTLSRKVPVRAGEESRVTLSLTEDAVAQK